MLAAYKKPVFPKHGCLSVFKPSSQSEKWFKIMWCHFVFWSTVRRFVKDSACSTWAADGKLKTVKMKLGGSYCTHYKPYVIYQLLLLWQGGGQWRRVWERKKKRERWRRKGWLVRQEERKNFSMMKQSVLLSDWTRPPPMGGPAPWQQALSPREKQPYPSTPPYFSFPFSLTTPSFPPLQSLVYLSLGTHIHK